MLPAGIFIFYWHWHCREADARNRNNRDTFDERDTRVFKAVACTKDKKPVEALYYISASRADLSAGKASPSAQLMKDEIENNWQRITSQLTMEQVLEERFSDTYHSVFERNDSSPPASGRREEWCVRCCFRGQQPVNGSGQGPGCSHL